MGEHVFLSKGEIIKVRFAGHDHHLLYRDCTVQIQVKNIVPEEYTKHNSYISCSFLLIKQCIGFFSPVSQFKKDFFSPDKCEPGLKYNPTRKKILWIICQLSRGAHPEEIAGGMNVSRRRICQRKQQYRHEGISRERNDSGRKKRPGILQSRFILFF